MTWDLAKGIAKYEDEPIDLPKPEAKWFFWVSDGGPKPKDPLVKLTYDSPNRHYRLTTRAGLAEDMYDANRMSVIDKCVGFAKQAQAQCFVVTTGYGPVDALKKRKAYNIPGDVAVKNPMYKSFLQKRIAGVLNAIKPPRIIVYYAPGTKEKFRDEVFETVCSMKNTRFAMYGASRHSTEWRSLLDEIVQSLENENAKDLDDLREVWKAAVPNTYPFFRFCVGKKG